MIALGFPISEIADDVIELSSSDDETPLSMVAARKRVKSTTTAQSSEGQ